MTLQAGRGTLEMGIKMDTHGWVKVRAELNVGTGEVAAVVQAASPHAAETLHGALPALQTFLAVEQVTLSSLTVTHTPSSEVSTFQQEAQGGERREQGNAEASMPGTPPEDRVSYADPHGEAVPLPIRSGGWLHVVA